MNQPDLFSFQTPEVSPAVSEDFSDIIFRFQSAAQTALDELEGYFPQIVDNQYVILHAPLSENLATAEQIGYSGVPKLFTFISTQSLESAGILAVQIQPNLQLSGAGILIGFLDSGIDYTHPAFRASDGRTKILRIWDQTRQEGPAPEGMLYGTEYTEDEINGALFSGAPYERLPERDENGHGTAVAGIACGSYDAEQNFVGAAPESRIAFVKLKPAKQYLRDYFFIPEDSIAYQESDLMLGVRYLVNTARQLQMPLVICITLGTNQGGHTGNTPLEEVLSAAQFNSYVYVTAGAGNEAGQGHHFQGQQSGVDDYTDIELLVNEETRGFTVEFWANAPELYSIGFTSPLGQTVEPIQPRTGFSREIDFLLEDSKIYLDFLVVEIVSGSQLAQIRFEAPSSGIWRIRVVNKIFISGTFHLWLPITGLVDEMIRFLSPSADTTLVIPSCADSLITVGAYNAYNNSLYINSGRGYTRNGLVKPDFVSPGVQVTAPAPDGRYSSVTGSSAASALTAGACALLLEQGPWLNPMAAFTPGELKSLFLYGARRGEFYTYPNPEWGYGAMDVYGIYETFLNV